MLNKEAVMPLVRFSEMAEEALADKSFGLDITAWEVRPIQMMTPAGPIPGWGVCYWIKSPLLGEGPLAQMTTIGDPYIDKAIFDAAIQEGCDSLRNSRAERLNGSHS